jgi:hypothetical protein
MVRNIILFVSATAVLVLLFVGYMSLLGSPAPDGQIPKADRIELSVATQVADQKKLRVETPEGQIEIDPGESMAYVQYDQLGRPTDLFRCETWEKVPGAANSLAVTRPELTMRLPTGMIVTVTADHGQLSADRIESKRPRPKFGWLAGDARIIVDRETRYDRTPLSQRPEDRITISMDRLDFDLELGELKTADPIRVTSPELEITGTGLHLIWNQDDNRVEKLLIEKGGRMVFEGSLLAALDRPSGRSRSDEPPPVTQPAPHADDTSRENTRQPTAYRCVFSDNVSVDHYVGDARRGALSADELSLLVDIAGQSGGLSRRGRATASAPTTQRDAAPKRRVVVQWTGPLLIRPDSEPPSSDQPRRRFEARGGPVTVELPNGRVVCGRLALHEETERLWLYPTEEGHVEISSGRDLIVQAASIFIDFEVDTVKLVGDVLFKSGVGRSAGDDALTISASLWAELRLAPEGDVVEGVFDNPLASRPPESAVFVGDVVVGYQDQLLRANQLEAHFSPASESAGADDGASALRAMLDSAVATGDVHLTVAARDARRGDWRTVLERGVETLRRGKAGSQSAAVGREFLPAVPGEDRSLTCASLRLDFVTTDGKIHIHDVAATGAVQLYDRDSRFAARGRRLNATLTPDEDLRRAVVVGSDSEPAVVQARGYDLRGKEIEADNVARTLHIDGPSTLQFDSRRSLRGFTRNRTDETITVTSNRSLHVDERGNTVEFVGAVVAGTQNEQLLADTLTLLLEDMTEAAKPPAPKNSPAAFRGLLGKLFGKPESSRPSRSLFGDAGSNGETRKELARLVARNAAIQSESYTTDGARLLEHQSVSAPELQIDVRSRMIRTVGETVLGMTDYRLRREGESASSSLDVPSSLLARGPSQTAMVCHQGLVYMLGEEGPERRDSALLEGGVALRRVAGRKIEDLEQMLPDVVRNPELLKNLESRNSWLFCDRLEVLFAVGDAARTPALLGSTRGSLRLSWFNALGNVYFRDQQERSIREVYAHQLEYDGGNAIVRALGLSEEGIDARIYDEDPQSGRFNIPAQGPALIWHIDTNTIEAEEGIRGRIGT